MDSLRSREKDLVWGPQLTEEGARPLTSEKFSLLFLMLPLVLTNSETRFSLSQAKLCEAYCNDLSDSKKELLWCWVNMNNFKLCLGQDFYRMMLWGQVQRQQGLHGTTRKVLPGTKSHPRPPPLCSPVNRCRGYTRRDQCTGFFVCLTLDWVITTRTWTFAFHTYVLRPLESVQTHQNLRLRQSSWPRDKSLENFWNT